MRPVPEPEVIHSAVNARGEVATGEDVGEAEAWNAGDPGLIIDMVAAAGAGGSTFFGEYGKRSGSRRSRGANSLG